MFILLVADSWAKPEARCEDHQNKISLAGECSYLLTIFTLTGCRWARGSPLSSFNTVCILSFLEIRLCVTQMNFILTANCLLMMACRIFPPHHCSCGMTF